jgi:hypothetical protein
MFRVRALTRYTWDRVEYQPGQVFEVADIERPQFQFINDHIPGIIEIVPDELATTQQTPVTTPAPAEPALRPPALSDSIEPQTAGTQSEPMTTENAGALLPPPGRRRFVRKPRE